MMHATRPVVICLLLGLSGCLPLTARVTPGTFLSPDQVREDLDQFQRELEGRFAYLKANGENDRSAIRSLREKGSNGMTVHELGIELKKVIALSIDGYGLT